MSSAFKALIAVFLLVSSAAGQATNLPQCAQGCANQAAKTVNCGLSDTVCLCKTSFASTVLQCAGTTSCSPADQAQVSTILEGMCAAVSSSAPTSSASASNSASRSVSLSVSVSGTGNSAPSVPLTQTTITSIIVSVSPPRTTTITTSVPVSFTIVPPPISLSSVPTPSLPSASLPSTVPSASATRPIVSSAPSSSPSPSTGAAQGMKVHAAGVAGAFFGIGVTMWLL